MPRPELPELHVSRERLQDWFETLKGTGHNQLIFNGSQARVVQATRSDDGRKAEVTVRLQVQDHHANPLGMLHGGAAAALVDVITSLPIILLSNGNSGEPWSLLGVSTSLSCTYLTAAPIGSWVDYVARVESIGKMIATLSCDVYDVPDGEHGTEHGAKRLTGMHAKFDNSVGGKAKL